MTSKDILQSSIYNDNMNYGKNIKDNKNLKSIKNNNGNISSNTIKIQPN